MASLLNVTETQVTYSCVRQAQLTVIIRKYCAYLVWPCLEVNPHDKA